MNAPATVATATAPEFIGTATYSPEDNKLRLYPFHRLSTEDYNRVKEAGFAWAPRQELFVAPMWTPQREDLIIELCGELGDEDTSLLERAEDRADRFEEYSEKRTADYERAHAGVKAIADMIPMGQPILVGHHSERRARKDAEKIENGMRQAVKMWDTAQYWERRAAGAVRAAKYKERPDVRFRRIKTIEADRRKQERSREEAQKILAFWQREDITKELALKVLSYIDRGGCRLPDGEPHYCAWTALDADKITVEEIRAQRLASAPRRIEHYTRWINHCNNRIAYERAMIGEMPADKWENITVGGRVQVGGEWCTVLKINKKGGAISSIGTNRRYVSKVGIEEVQAYEPPSEETAAKVKAAVAKAPLCNYPADSIGVLNIYHGTIDSYPVIEMSKEEYSRTHKDYKGTRDVPATPTAARHRVRIVMKQSRLYAAFITDEKRKDAPAPDTTPAAAVPPVEPARRAAPPAAPAGVTRATVDAMRDTLRAGVQVVSAPQLFPTPPDVAARMVSMLELRDGCTVLEPSAGTGALLQAIRAAGVPDVTGTAVEVNYSLAEGLRSASPGMYFEVICTDFLSVHGRTWDRIIMNPPFINGADIKHIEHAAGCLAPGGVLVALCAAGPRQHEKLQPLADYWEVLPAGTFKAQGTGVNVALLVIRG